jgi:hypothetical protein
MLLRAARRADRESNGHRLPRQNLAAGKSAPVAAVAGKRYSTQPGVRLLVFPDGRCAVPCGVGAMSEDRDRDAAWVSESQLQAAPGGVPGGCRRPNDAEWNDDLRRRIAEVACRVAGRFASHIRQDLVKEAESIVWERFHLFDPNRGTFETWCYAVLCNKVRDRIKCKRESKGVHPATGDELLEPAAPNDELASRRLSEELNELRGALDAIDPGLDAGVRVHWYAVLLLQLRLVIAHKLQRVDWGAQEPADVSGLAEYLLPWRLHEADFRIEPGWPTLQQIWDAFGQRFLAIGDGAAPSVDARVLLDVVCQLLGDPAAATPDRWHQRVKRAKENARREAGTEQWNRLFRTLLPDRAGSEGGGT